MELRVAQSDEERREYQRQWKAKKLATDPEYFRRYRREWTKNNPDKIRVHQKRGRPRMIERAKERYWERREEYQEKAGTYRDEHRLHIRKQARKNYALNRESRRKLNRKYYKQKGRDSGIDENGKFKSKAGLARWALNWARLYGFVDKPEACSECGATPGTRLIHGHHEDYDKPFVVEWLCSVCHGRRHRMKDEEFTETLDGAPS